MSQKYLTHKAAARRLIETGMPYTARAIRGWTERFPESRSMIAGHCVVAAEFLDLILAGMPTGAAAAKLCERSMGDGLAE